MKDNSTDFEVIYTDNSAIYVKESHLVFNRLSLNNPVRESASLLKFDKNLKMVFSTDFNKELNGKEFERIFFLGGKVFLLASDYNKNEKKLTLYGTELDIKSGQQIGEWVMLTDNVKEEKKDEISFKIKYNFDSTRMLIVGTVFAKDKINYKIVQIDNSMKMSGKAILFNNEFASGSFRLEDVIVTDNGNITVLGRKYELDESDKRFVRYGPHYDYLLQLYSTNGKPIKQLLTGTDGKWLVNAIITFSTSKKIILTGFYTGKVNRKIDGILAQVIDPQTGETISNNQKEFTAKMIAAKKDNTPDVKLFTLHVKFKDPILMPDKSIIVLAEQSISSQLNFGGLFSDKGSYSTYDCNNIFMYKIDEIGNVQWLNIIPKTQHETIPTKSVSYDGANYLVTNYTYLYEDYFNWPFYAGFGIMKYKNMICIVFNDDSNNAGITQYGQLPKTIDKYKNSICYTIILDPNTGNCTRSQVFNNSDKDIPTAMPRMGKMLDEDFYLIGNQERFVGKSKIALAKISFKK
ncbi:hypothetical protein GCM10027043_46240 [Ferruginibacter profundus]